MAEKISIDEAVRRRNEREAAQRSQPGAQPRPPEKISLEEAKRRRAEREAAERAARSGAKAPPHEGKANGHAKAKRFQLTFLPDLGPVGIQDRLVRGLIGEDQLAMLYGETGAGKSFTAFDGGVHIALGWDWFGRKVTQGAVLYVAAEGRGGWANRKAAFCRHHGLDAEAEALVPIAFILSAINLGPQGSGDVDAIVAAAQELAERTDKPTRLVIIDTMNRATPGSNENDAADMGAFIAKCDEIRRRTGATVLIVHHSGKNAALGARGHSSLRAAVDCELEVERINGHRLLRVRKNRDGLDGLELGFALTPIEVGRDEVDQPIMSCVVEAAEVVRSATPEEKKAHRATAQLRAFMDAVRQALDLHGATITPFADGPRLRAVEAEKVRAIYYTMRADDLAEASRKTVFNRHFRNATDTQAVVTREIDKVAMVWLGTKP